jgi:hypothetical protein
MFRLIRRLFQWKILKWVSISCILFIILLWGINNILVAYWSNYELRYNNPQKYTDMIQGLDQTIDIPTEIVINPAINKTLNRKIFGSKEEPLQHWINIGENEQALNDYLWNTPTTQKQFQEINTFLQTMEPTIEYYNQLAKEVHDFFLTHDTHDAHILTTEPWSLIRVINVLCVAADNAERQGDSEKAIQLLYSGLSYLLETPSNLSSNYNTLLWYKTIVLSKIKRVLENYSDSQKCELLLQHFNQVEPYIVLDVDFDESLYILFANTTRRWTISESELRDFAGKTVRDYLRFIVQKKKQHPGILVRANTLLEMYLGIYQNDMKIQARWELMKSLALFSTHEEEELFDVFQYFFIEEYFDSKVKVKSDFDQIRISLAVRLFFEEHGEYPNSTKQLVPEYLAREFINPYTDRPYQLNENGDIETTIDFGKNQ